MKKVTLPQKAKDFKVMYLDKAVPKFSNCSYNTIYLSELNIAL